MSCLVEASYSITVPQGCAPPTTTASTSSSSATTTTITSSSSAQPLPNQARIAVPLKLSLSHTPGAPHSSRETESEYLGALADSIDELKAKLMVDMSAWKDSVGQFEDAEAKRAGDKGGERVSKGQRGGTNGQEDEEEEDEDEEDEEEEDGDDDE